jgi:Zn finger protein HypA/HybF involved in hydrogenase expression
MFPENAEFICRKCLTNFFFKPEEFWQIEEGGIMGCPQCRITSDKPGVVSRFFKFYPRFIAATEKIKESGFDMTNYKVKVGDYGMMWIESILFRCNDCGNTSIYPLSRIDKFAEEPGLFACKKCRKQASPIKIVKEFFVSFRWVHRSAFRLHNFLWDVLSPIQLDPADFPVQYPIYKENKG